MTVTLSDNGGQPVEEYTVSRIGHDGYVILFDTFRYIIQYIVLLTSLTLHMSVGKFSSVYMSGLRQWDSDGVWWICRLAVDWECHRTVFDEWSDLHCQCGRKKQHWIKRDIHWHGVCTL